MGLKLNYLNTKCKSSWLINRCMKKHNKNPAQTQHAWPSYIERWPTVMFIRTLMLVWSKRTVTERNPSSTTTTARGKRKKATSAEASRQSTTDSTTYSFLQHRTCWFSPKDWNQTVSTVFCSNLRSSGLQPLVAVWDQCNQFVHLACWGRDNSAGNRPFPLWQQSCFLH